MEISEAIQNARTIEELVDIVNSGGTAFYTPEELAAQYAYHGEDGEIEVLMAHLDFLIEEGAEFDYFEAARILEQAA